MMNYEGIRRKNLLEGSCFFDKNFQFLLKKQLHSTKPLSARLLSVAKNSALCVMLYQRYNFDYKKLQTKEKEKS